MSAKKSLFFKLSFVAVVFLMVMVVISSVLIIGKPTSPRHIGVVDDWSFHRVIYSNPGTYAEAIAKGTYYKWYHIQYDNRYIMQQMKRSSGVQPVADAGTARVTSLASLGTAAWNALTSLGTAYLNALASPWIPVVNAASTKKKGLNKDWNETLTAGQIQPNTYPATWASSGTSASCANDFIVYPTGSAGSGTNASIVAYNQLYVGGTGCTTVPSVYWAYNTGGTITTSPVVSLAGTEVAFIQVSVATASLAVVKWAQTPTPPAGVKGTFSTGSTTVTITAGTVTPSDVGMQISGTDIPANDTIAGVTGNPATSITLASATTGTVTTAETLTIHSETLALPGVAPTGTPSSCTAPCMTTISLTHNDTFSSPFYDFSPGSDAVYVGDDSGYLNKYTGVFNGTPTQAWSLRLTTTKMLTSPTYDSVSGNIFVGDTGNR